MNHDYDVAVVGGGLVGLATAYQLLRQHPGLRVVVLEKESSVAQHQSGHNSGVIHSGINYRPGSLKARLCREGARELFAFAAKYDIDVRRTGKLVAARADELVAMRSLAERARANGLIGVREVPLAELREREPRLRAAGALEVPETATVDYVEVALAYARAVSTQGGSIQLDTEVDGFSNGKGAVLHTNRGDISAHVVVSCAGLQSDRLAAAAGLRLPARIVPFRGNYFQLSSEAECFLNSTVYPVPDPRLPFLGVHFTRRHDGRMWVGPNAVLALAREGYPGRPRIVWRDINETLRYRGFWRLASRHIPDGARELARDRITSLTLRALQEYLPDLRRSDLHPVATATGIRAQAVATDGSLLDDFLFLEAPAMVFVLNAPSPAATASLAIGRLVADKAFGHLPD